MFGERKEEASVPVDDNEDVHDQVCDAEDVGVVGFSLGPREELHQAADSQQLVEADLWVVEAVVQIQDVSGQHGDEVETKLEAGHVAIPEQLLVFHQQALFKVTCIQTSIEFIEKGSLSLI